MPSKDISRELQAAMMGTVTGFGSYGGLNLASTSQTATSWCAFESGKNSERRLMFNEIAWMGSPVDPNEEWIELRSVSGSSLSLEHWQIQSGNGGVRIDLSSSGPIAAKNILVLRRGQDYSGALSNAGASLKIFDDRCDVVDTLDASGGWPAGDRSGKKTLERDNDDRGWHTSVKSGGSPGEINSTPVLASASSSIRSDDLATSSVTQIASQTISGIYPSSRQYRSATSSASSSEKDPATATTSTPVLVPLVISSVQITAGEGATGHDLVEIFNPSSESADISGWKLRKRTQNGTESSIKVFPDGSFVHPGGYIVWANSAAGFSDSIGATFSSTQTLAADNSIALLSASDRLIDALAWGSGHASPFIEGSAYAENPGPNQRLSRKFEAGKIKDSGQNSEDFTLLTLPGSSI